MVNYVDINYLSSADSAESAFSAYIEEAAAFWNSAIRGGHSGVTVEKETYLGDCGIDSFLEEGETIEGVKVYASVELIDGDRGVMAQSGPCLFHENFPAVGVMQLDATDIPLLVQNGNLVDVVKHEIAQILGFGTLWGSRSFLNNLCTGRFGLCEGNPSYNRAGALAGFHQLGGELSEVLAVENARGEGTWNVHWRESMFGNELMTGFLSLGMPNPVSIMTLKAMEDIGYDVNTAVAEEYTIPSEHLRPFGVEIVELFGDILAFDQKDIALAGEESVGRVSAARLFAAESENYSNEFGGLFGLMIIGFASLGFVTYYYNRKQQQELSNIFASAAVQPASGPSATKNAMFEA